MVTQDTCGFMVFCEPQKIRPWSRGTGERRTSYNPERVLYRERFTFVFAERLMTRLSCRTSLCRAGTVTL